jgi:hypothetical protein
MRIGVIKYWVGRPAAEHETLERFKRAACLVNHEIIELRPDGKTFTGEKAVVDFIINLHFASGKSTSDLTYGALWNPWNFYHGWGFAKTYANQISNDFLISCQAVNIDNRFSRNYLPKIISQKLHHTVPPEYKVPENRTDRKLFYIGVNWEKSSNRHGRHHGLLKELDNLGALEIYGPRKIGNVKPWEGFKSYRGDLPFDGTSVIEKAHEAGAVLVLSSQDHLQDQIMTSRLFEGLAAGAAIVGDRHNFLEQNFKDEVWQFDNSFSLKQQALQIICILNSINSNESNATDKITHGQLKMRKYFNLSTQIDEIAKHAQSQIKNQRNIQTRSATALVFLVGSNHNIETFINQLFASCFSQIIIISNETQVINTHDSVIFKQLSPNSSYSEFIYAYLLLEDDSEFLTIFTGDEEIFPNFLEATDSLEESQIAVLVTGSNISLSGEHYADAINATSTSWHENRLGGLIIRKSIFQFLMNDFQSFIIHAVIYDNFFFFHSSKLVKLDPLVRFSFFDAAPSVGEIQGSEYYKFRSQIFGNWSPIPSTNFTKNLVENIRVKGSQEVLPTNGRYFLTQIYKGLLVPKWLDSIIRKVGVRLFR